MSNLHRVQWLNTQIKNNKYPNINNLISEFEISQRQAYRDIEYMKDSLNVPIKYSKKHKGYYYTDSSFDIPAITLTEKQKNILSFLADQYERFSDENSRQLANLFVNLSGKKNEFINNIPFFNIDPKISDKLDLISKAIDNNIRLTVTYIDLKNKNNNRVVSPYQIFTKFNNTYFVGFCHLRNDLRFFRVDRIDKIDLNEEKRYICPYYRKEDYTDTYVSFSEKKPYECKIIIYENIKINELPYRAKSYENNLYIIEFTDSKEFINFLFSLNVKLKIISPIWLKIKIKNKMNNFL